MNEAKLERFFLVQTKKRSQWIKMLKSKGPKDLNSVSSFGFELKFRSSKKTNGMIYQKNRPGPSINLQSHNGSHNGATLCRPQIRTDRFNQVQSI